MCAPDILQVRLLLLPVENNQNAYCSHRQLTDSISRCRFDPAPRADGSSGFVIVKQYDGRLIPCPAL
jgi:hypothetical protein